MKPGKTFAVLAVALIAACGGQSPASSIQNQDEGAGVTQDVLDDNQPAAESPTRVSGADGRDASPDAGLFRSSFDECVTKAEGVTPDTQACIESEFEFHDARLQLAYRKHSQSLEGEALRVANQAQEAWLAMREKECAWDAENEGQGQRLDANYCNLRSTAMRANQLEEMLAKQK